METMKENMKKMGYDTLEEIKNLRSRTLHTLADCVQLDMNEEVEKLNEALEQLDELELKTKSILDSIDDPIRILMMVF